MKKAFFTDDENLAELVSRLPEDLQKQFNGYGHFRVEAAFIDRVFIVYKPTGLNAAGRHKEPNILTMVKVIDFSVDPRDGCCAVVEDQTFKQQQTLTHVPRKLFNYPVFVSIPPRCTLRYDAKLVNERVWRSLSFAFLIKTKNKADFYSHGNLYLETPTSFKRLYPGVIPEGFKF